MQFSKKLIGSTTTTLLLAVLSEKERHGYEKLTNFPRGCFSGEREPSIPHYIALKSKVLSLVIGWQVTQAASEGCMPSLRSVRRS